MYKRIAISEIGTIVSGATPKTSDETNYGGDIPWLTPADLSGYTNKYIERGARNISKKGYDSCSTQIMPAGSILFSSRAPIGYVAIAANPICTNQGFKSIVPNKNVDSEFLFYQLKFLKNQIADLGRGTTFKEISGKTLGSVEIVLPDLKEQKRIVNEIEELFSELDSAVETLKKTKEQLAVYRQSVLKEVFSNDNWINVKLGEVLDVLTDYHSNGSYKTLKENVELLDAPSYAIMVRSTNFEKNDFKKNLKYISESSYNFLKKSQLYGGEVLMGKIGNAGKVYYLKDLGCPMSLAMNLFAMRFKKEINSKYAYYFLISPEATNDIKQYVKGVGTPTIDKKSVRSINFRYPNFLTQSRVVEIIESRLTVCDNIEKTINEALMQADAMRQSILKKAFEGSL